MTDRREAAGRPPRCVVVGSGVLGVTSALRLVQAGAEVTLVDQGSGAGSSRATFAHVNASYSGYWDYVELRRAGVEGYHLMKQGPEGAEWWHDTGYLSVHREGAPVAALDAHIDRLAALGYPAARISDDPSALEPALDLAEVERTYHFASEGYVDVAAMLGDLTTRSRRLGVDVRSHDPVTAVQLSGQEVTGVQLQSGDRIECDQLVVCCGRWTDQVLAMAGLETRLVAHEAAAGTPAPGLLVVTDTVQGSVRGVVSVDDINYRPDPGGRTMVWSGVVDQQLVQMGGPDIDPDVARQLAEELLAAASQHVPALRSTRVDQARVTMRALPSDGLPVVGRPSNVDGVYVVLAHAAVTLAPALSEAVVTEVAHDRDDPRLARFRPDRFLTVREPTSDAVQQKEHADDLAAKH